MNRWLVWLLLAGTTTAAYARNPDDLDTTLLFKKAVQSVKDADATSDKTNAALTQALVAFEELQTRFPDFQPDVVAARIAECRQRLKPSVGLTDASKTTPSELTLAKHYADALAENTRLRRLLAAARSDAKTAPVDLAPDLVKALKMVSKQAQEIKALKEASIADIRSAKEVIARHRKELDDLSQRNLDMLANAGGLQAKLKKQEAEYDELKETKFRDLHELKALKTKHAKLQDELTSVQADFETLKTAMEALDAGKQDALKKALLQAVKSQAVQRQGLEAEQAKAKDLNEKMAKQRQQMDILQLGNEKIRKEIRLLKMGVETVIIAELELMVDKLKTDLRKAHATISSMEEMVAAKNDLRHTISAMRPLTTPSKDTKELLDAKQRVIDEQTRAITELKVENLNLRGELSRGKVAVDDSQAGVANPQLSDEQRQELQIFRQQAAASLKHGDLATATAHCKKALSMAPQEGELNVLLAEILLLSGEPLNVGTHVALALDAGVPPSRIATLLDRIAFPDSQPVNWLAFAFDTVRKRPNDHAFNRFLGRALSRYGTPDMADAQLRHAWSLKKDFETAKALHDLYQSRGKAYDKQRKLWYDRASKIAPNRIGELRISERKGKVE